MIGIIAGVTQSSQMHFFPRDKLVRRVASLKSINKYHFRGRPMRFKYLVFITSLVLATMFSTQFASAHPPQMHKEVKKEQTQTQTQAPAHNDEGTQAHEHDDNAETAMPEQMGEQMAEMGEHQEAGEAEGHSHAAGQGHDEASGGHDEADCGDAADEEGGHSHWGISPDSSPFSKLMAAFGKYHPLVVHFPIALFITAAFGQFLSIRSREEKYTNAVKLLVWTGALGALAAGTLGWMHSGPVQVNENAVMSTHRWLGTAIAIFGLIIVYVMKKAAAKEGGLPKDLVFNVMIFAMAAAVSLNGFLGGALAHGGIKHLLPGFG